MPSRHRWLLHFMIRMSSGHVLFPVSSFWDRAQQAAGCVPAPHWPRVKQHKAAKRHQWCLPGTYFIEDVFIVFHNRWKCHFASNRVLIVNNPNFCTCPSGQSGATANFEGLAKFSDRRQIRWPQLFIKLAFEFGCDVIFISHPIW